MSTRTGHVRQTKNTISVEIIAMNDGTELTHGYSGRQEMSIADATHIQAKITVRNKETGVALRDRNGLDIVDQWCYSHTNHTKKFGYTIWTGTSTAAIYQIQIEWNAYVDGNRIEWTELIEVEVVNHRKGAPA